jgi:hypothetical protein
VTATEYPSPLTGMLREIEDQGPRVIDPRTARAILARLGLLERRWRNAMIERDAALERARQAVAERDAAERATRGWRAREAQLIYQIEGAGRASSDVAERAVTLLVRIDDALDRGAEMEEWQEIEAEVGQFLDRKTRKAER